MSSFLGVDMKEGFLQVFQDFIYVPIISAIIGAVFTVFVPKLWTKIWEKL